MSLYKSEENDQTYLIWGYVREQEYELSVYVPIGVKRMCLEYYFGSDYFDEGYCGNNIISCNNQQIISMKNGIQIPNTAYGSKFINPSKSNKIHEWKFRVQQCNGYIYIGLDEAKSLHKNTWYSGRRNTLNYSYCCNGRKYSNRTGGMGQLYYSGYYINHIIIMILDLRKSGILSFGLMKYGNDYQNNNLFELLPAFKHIKKNKQLRMAIQLRSGSQIELLSYKEREC